ncbi:MarR family winged helix-turn-helix transcriptional regulator [Halalkalibacter lacteus]|uniref:MarR family winged helix-turn-helix transcriptional regulator n=1 Tax=Halalkalibacter lacteus TaxID=3090663 RepID=UPI002FCB73B6
MKQNGIFDQDQSLKLFVVMTRAIQAITKRVEEDIKSYGLNPTEFGVLELLYSKGNQPIQKIGEKVLLASSSITYVVDKLEKKQLLERKPCPKDRRVTYAVITELGERLMDDIFPKHREAIQEIFGGLEQGEKEVMISQLKKLGLYAEER